MKRRVSAEQRATGGGRALAFLLVALVSGVVGVTGLSGLLTSYEDAVREARRPEETVLVMVASRDLYQGVTITEEDLYAVQIPPRFLPEHVFLTPDHVVGRTPRERILANEFVRSDRLADPEAGVGMNAVIPRGMRAISVDLSDGRALSGFLRPADYVDVLVTMTPEGDADATTRTLLQSVFVLGVNHRMGSESDEEAATKRGRQNPSVTLLVTPDQAEQMAFASTTGRITLAMRTSTDLDPNTVVGGGVTLGQLRRQLFVPPPVRERPPEEEADCGGFRLIGGKRVRDYRVNCDGTLDL